MSWHALAHGSTPTGDGREGRSRQTTNPRLPCAAVRILLRCTRRERHDHFPFPVSHRLDPPPPPRALVLVETFVNSWSVSGRRSCGLRCCSLRRRRDGRCRRRRGGRPPKLRTGIGGNEPPPSGSRLRRHPRCQRRRRKPRPVSDGQRLRRRRRVQLRGKHVWVWTPERSQLLRGCQLSGRFGLRSWRRLFANRELKLWAVLRRGRLLLPYLRRPMRERQRLRIRRRPRARVLRL